MFCIIKCCIFINAVAKYVVINDFVNCYKFIFCTFIILNTLNEMKNFLTFMIYMFLGFSS